MRVEEIFCSLGTWQVLIAFKTALVVVANIVIVVVIVAMDAVFHVSELLQIICFCCCAIICLLLHRFVRCSAQWVKNIDS